MINKINKYKYLTGKTKKEILEDLGDEFNHFPDDKWTYFIGKNWFGKSSYLFLYFEEEKVKFIKIQKKFCR